MVKHLKEYWTKLEKFFYMFYVEPIVFVLAFSHSLSGTIMKNEVIYQTCTIIFHFNKSDCLQLGTTNVTDYMQEIETEIQPYAANLFMMRTVLESIIPAIGGVYMGSWSDYYGRKPLLLVSMIGFSCTYAIAAVICKMSQYHQVNPWFYVLTIIPHSILGGNCALSVAAFCFISDVTDVKTRPHRMIFFEAFLSVGMIVGSFLSSLVFAATSATFIFSFSGILICLASLYVAFYLPESLRFKSKDAQPNARQRVPHSLGKNDKLHEEEMKTTKAGGLFNYKYVKDMWITCFKTRPFYDRSIILLVTGSMFLTIFVVDGTMTVFFLFVREKFQWTIKEFTFYETMSHVTSLFGATIGFLIMRKIFNLSVVTLALMAILSDIIRSIIQSLATETWHLHVAILAGVLKAVGGPMCRTIISNIVPATDLGKIYSIKNILQSIAPLLAAPLYTIIYKASLTSFPSFFNIISTILYIIAFVFLVLVLRIKIKNNEHYGTILM